MAVSKIHHPNEKFHNSRKIEYENYLHELGMTNVVVYSDKLVDFGFESPCMEEVVAVYATPPNSYSAVTDPIDLVRSFFEVASHVAGD